MTTLDATSLSGQEHRGPPLLWVPNELLHKIFTYLTPTEAANFRQLHECIANIGVEYIVPVISLALIKDSFNKFEAIARHPRIRQHVGSMVFDGTVLPDLDREFWQRIFANLEMRLHDSALESEARQDAGQTGDSLRNQQYANDEVHRVFALYERHRHYHQEQCQLLRADAHLQRITQALKSFPSLKNIILDTSATRLWAAFGSLGYTTSIGDYPAGQGEVHAILYSAHGAGLRLESFRCSLLSWSHFSDSPRVYASYSESLTHLKSLDLVMSTREEIDGSFECLSTGGVLRSLTAAPYLDRLGLCVSTGFNLLFAEGLPYLDHFVGSFRWTLLVHVTIENIRTRENVLKGFLDRHSSTLRSVELGSVYLTDGKWMSIFRMMRSVLRLDAVDFSGYFREANEFFAFDTGDNVAADSFSKNVHDYILRATEDTQSIEAYLNQYTRRL